MAQAKTKPTEVSAATYLAAINDEARRKDCKDLAGLMKRVTGCSPKMWGPSIIGFDIYHYKYASGHEGDSCLVGFSSGKAHISIYLVSGYESAQTQELLSRLGKHKIGKACLSVKRLADVDMAVLETLVTESVTAIKKLYPLISKVS